MLDFIKEKENLWDRLKNETRPIVMYGMGDGALKIMRVFKEYGIKLTDIFASDEFVRGHSFEGFRVKKLSEIEETYDDFVIVMAFAIFDDSMTDRIKKIAKRHPFFAPDVPVFGNNLFTYEFAYENREKIQRVYDLLADDLSKKVYADIINYKISGKLSYLFSCQSTPEEAYENILKLGDNEVFADLGAYHGETVKEFLSYSKGNYEKIVCFEPDEKNFRRLSKNLDEMGVLASLFNGACYDKETELYFNKKAGRNSSISKEKTEKSVIVPANSLDNFMNGKRVSFVNMDIEGFEKEGIEGMRETIKKYKPKLLIASYHRSEDIFELPLRCLELNEEYKLYFRHYQYIPAWDTNLYCV